MSTTATPPNTNRRIKVCIVLPSHWAASFGGAEFQVRCLLDELEKHKDMEVFYLARNINSDFNPENYRILSVKHGYPVGNTTFLLDAPKLLTTLKEIAPDVIYQRVGGAYTGITAHYAKKSGCKMVWHIASNMDIAPVKTGFSTTVLIDYMDRKALDYGIRNATSIIAQTEEQSEILNKNYGRRPAAVIQNFHPHPEGEISKDDDKVTVLWIANLKPLKRPELFLDLAEELGPQTGANFVIIGRGNNGRWCSGVLRRAENIKHLEYFGERSHKEVNQILNRADILVNTSVVEGFSNTFIQAWMREVPVVSLDVDPDNILSKHGIGMLSSSYQQMVADTKKLIVEVELRRKMGQEARKYALANHSLDNAARIVDVLKEGLYGTADV